MSSVSNADEKAKSRGNLDLLCFKKTVLSSCLKLNFDAVKCMDVLTRQQKFEIELEVMLEFKKSKIMSFPYRQKFVDYYVSIE